MRPGVFHPALFASSRLLAGYVTGLDLTGRRFLDMGTGSGIVGLCAARAGARVVGVDVSPDAVACARANAASNGLADRFEAFQGDLLAPVAALPPFDLVAWNPPFYAGEPTSHLGPAWHAGPGHEVIGRFAGSVGAHLAPEGRVLLVLSSDVAEARLEDVFVARGFVPATVTRHRGLFETLSVVELR